MVCVEVLKDNVFVDGWYISLGLLWILYILWMNLIKKENGGNVILFCFLYLVVWEVYLFCRDMGSLVIMGSILVDELK